MKTELTSKTKKVVLEMYPLRKFRDYSAYPTEENRKWCAWGGYAPTHTIFRDFLVRPEQLQNFVL
jgi:hypothetical protein